jgi:hypothetical protein
MSALIQFIVLKREGRWVVKSMDLERFFPIQRQAINAAIRFANDRKGSQEWYSSKNRKPNSRRLDVQRESLSAREIGSAPNVGTSS